MRDLKAKLRALSSEVPSRSPTLKESLHRLYRRGDSEAGRHSDDSLTRARRGIHEFVEGQYVNTAFGDVFVGKVQHARDYVHGNVPLRFVSEINDTWLARWGKFLSPKKFDYRKAIFIDTETSGLAGGGGTIPFLIGIGYFYRNRFRIEQFFADSHSLEEGMLDLIFEFVKPFDTLITFNGKAFDIPLVETRYILKRKQSPFSRMEHLDLLHPCRQLWGLSLDDCKLQTIEREILGFQRENDLPGEEIPYAYFDYVRYGQSDPLYRVFQHNADDITSLAAFTYLLWQGIQGLDGEKTASLQLSRGKILNRLGEIDRALESLELARRCETSPGRRMVILSHLSMLYKSLGQWKRAESLWQEMVDRSGIFYLLPYVELAKYYEHRIKNLSRAKELVEASLARISPHRTRDVEALNHRLNRLKRKIDRQSALRK